MTGTGRTGASIKVSVKGQSVWGLRWSRKGNTIDINEKLHKIYDECRALDQEYNGFISGELIEEIKTDEERRFAVHISNFFLAEKQQELVKKGLF